LVTTSYRGLGRTIEWLLPYLTICYDWYLKFRIWSDHHQLELLVPAAAGFVMCFCGGAYLALIAVVEAYHLAGYGHTITCLRHLSEDFRLFLAAHQLESESEPALSAAASTGSDGARLAVPPSPPSPPPPESQRAYLQRQIRLFLRTVDPMRLTEAFTALRSTFFAVISVLKLEFAKSIALGHALGSLLEQSSGARYVIAVATTIVAPEYRRWIPPVLGYCLRSLAISASWFLHRHVAAFHAALRGGFMLTIHVWDYLVIRQILPPRIPPTETTTTETPPVEETAGHHQLPLELLAYAVAMIGLFFQLRYHFGLPFPFNVLLFPVTCLEYFLEQIASFS
jgi:hypothetical protein